MGRKTRYLPDDTHLVEVTCRVIQRRFLLRPSPWLKAMIVGTLARFQERHVRIVLEGLRGEESIAALCRREGIAANLCYRWSKEFLEAGKKRLSGDTVREATSDEVKVLRSENRELKEVVAEVTLKNRVLKKSLTGLGEEGAS